MSQVLKKGDEAWIDCEVKPGPFPHERMVRVQKNGSTWVGFAHEGQLREPVPQGPTKIRVRVLTLDGDQFTAQVLGHSVTPQRIHGSVAEAETIDS